jgi:hypothetical protein
VTPRAGWAEFLERARAAYPAAVHGADLIDAMIVASAGRYYTGPSDADDALKAAEREGVLVRGAWAPTLTQRAMLGLTYGKKPDEDTRRFYASHWQWTAVPAT